MLAVDQDYESFQRNPIDDSIRVCPRCPGWDCASCFATAIAANGVAGWNAAHRAAFGWDKLYQVESNPHDLLITMPDKDWVRTYYPDNQKAAIFDNRQAKRTVETCCGTVFRIKKATIYVNYESTDGSKSWKPPWGLGQDQMISARAAIVHEMGHAISAFLDYRDGSGLPQFQSVMNAFVGGDWPLLADGQALACHFAPYYQCLPCQHP